MNRRHFLKRTLRLGAGLLSTGAFGTLGSCAAGCPERVPVPKHPRRVLADIHVHPLLDEWVKLSPLAVRYPVLADIAAREFNQTTVRWETAHQARIDLMAVAHFNVFDEWLSMPTDPNPEAPRNTLRMLDLLEAELCGPARPYARMALNAEQLQTLLTVPKHSPDFRIAVLHTLEGGHALGGDLSALEHFARRGVALITITHFFNKGIASAANSFPFFPDANSRWPYQGLSEFGKEVIREMERLGMLVDVTHATAAAMADILKTARKPLVATHASARTLGDHPYSLYDEHILEIIRRDGLVCVLFLPYLLSNFSNVGLAARHGTLQDVVRTIRYIYKISGSHKHIGIGSDFSGYIQGPKDMICLGEIEVFRRMLLQEFGDEEIVEDIMANNVIRFLTRHWTSGPPEEGSGG